MARILIVDDSKFMRLLLRNFLERDSNGAHQVVGEAASTQEAVEKYKELKPDLVTLDIIMPEEDGIVAMKKIKEIDPSAKIIMVTAVDQDGIIEEALKMGAQGYITKPIKVEKLLEEIKKVMES